MKIQCGLVTLTKAPHTDPIVFEYPLFGFSEMTEGVVESKLAARVN